MTSASNTVDIDIPAPRARPWTRERTLGFALMGLWIVVFAALAIYLVAAWNPELFHRWAPAYLSGLSTTLLLTVISTILGAILSIPVAWARMSQNRIAQVVSYGYVYFFRGTPLLAQTFLIYYGIGSFREELQAVGLWGFFREAWYCAILAFTLNTSAYQAEILRGAIQSVPKGQREGAASLGLHTMQTLRMVILPQALIVALRPYGNEIVLMIKSSAVVALITVPDLMGQTRLAFSRSFDFQTYVWAALIYLAIVELLRHGVDWIERYLTRHLVR
jgi:polar amino acid transport system permease protein